uniref:Uncharacterized protein n=1 Tax=Bionectria ochroleuca TaxID=29856 RepID=A0A0B7JVL7_BIOOC
MLDGDSVQQPGRAIFYRDRHGRTTIKWQRQFSLCARGMEPGGIPSHPASKPGIPNRATPLPELCRSFNHQASQSWLFQGTGAIQGALNGFPRLHAAVVHTHPSALALPNPFIFAGDPATALEVINPLTKREGKRRVPKQGYY